MPLYYRGRTSPISSAMAAYQRTRRAIIIAHRRSRKPTSRQAAVQQALHVLIPAINPWTIDRHRFRHCSATGPYHCSAEGHNCDQIGSLPDRAGAARQAHHGGSSCRTKSATWSRLGLGVGAARSPRWTATTAPGVIRVRPVGAPVPGPYPLPSPGAPRPRCHRSAGDSIRLCSIRKPGTTINHDQAVRVSHPRC